MTPLHSIDSCPICGGGLLGVRVCPGDMVVENTGEAAIQDTGEASIQDTGEASIQDTGEAEIPESTKVDRRDPHGLVICDECEAIWLEPDSSSMHLYPAAENSQCPICDAALWDHTHWANAAEIEQLGWADAINPELDFVDDDATGDQNVV